MKAVVATFNQEKALVGAFSVIVKTGCGTDGSICGTSPAPVSALQTTLKYPAWQPPRPQLEQFEYSKQVEQLF